MPETTDELLKGSRIVSRRPPPVIRATTTRRGFLQSALRAGVGLAAARGAIAFKSDMEEFGHDQKETRANGEEPKHERLKTEIDVAFANLPNDQREGAVNKVRMAESLILSNISNEQIKQMSNYESLVRSKAQEAGIPEDLFLGLVFWESKGNPQAISDDGAKGLTQMMEGMAKAYGLKIGGQEDERFIPEKILEATAAELKKYWSKFGDWGLAFWTWHAGENKVYKSLRVHLKEQFSDDLPDINVASQGDSREARDAEVLEVQRRKDQYLQRIQERGVSSYHLLQNQTIIKMFSGPEMDETLEFVPRVVAASRVYQGQKELLGIG